VNIKVMVYLGRLKIPGDFPGPCVREEEPKQVPWHQRGCEYWHRMNPISEEMAREMSRTFKQREIESKYEIIDEKYKKLEEESNVLKEIIKELEGRK